MGILIIQSSTWVMRFCDVMIMPLARAWLADPALCPRLARTLALSSKIDSASVLEDAEGSAYLSLRCVDFTYWAYPPSQLRWNRSIDS